MVGHDAPYVMRVTPNGMSEYKDDNEVLRYGRDTESGEVVATWYHSGVRNNDEPVWAMDTDVAWKVSVSVDTILVPHAEHGLFAIDRDEFTERATTLDGRDQYVARASDDFVTKVSDDPDECLRGSLWVTAENGHGGYHKDKNES